MPILHFVDQAPSPLGKLERTAQGGYVAPANLARVGVVPYLADTMRAQGIDVPAHIPKGGIVMIYTPPEALQGAVEALREGTCPVTDGHPGKMVDAESYEKVVRGNVIGQSVEFDGTFLKGKLAIQSKSLLDKIERNERREVSMGYYSDTVFEDATAPDGTAYHARRVSIVHNHTAILPRGRHGPQVCLALDSMEIPTEEDTNVTVKLKIKGVEVDADKAQAVIDALEAELVVANKSATDTRAALDAKDKEMKEAVSDEALDKRVEKKLADEKAAKEKAERLQAVKDGYPGLELEGKSAEFVDGLFQGLEKLKEADPDGIKRLRGEVGDKVPGHAATDEAEREFKQSARDKMLARNRELAAKKA